MVRLIYASAGLYGNTAQRGCLCGLRHSSIVLPATLVQGTTDAHLLEVVTVGTEVVTVSEGCGLVNGLAVCTVVDEAPGTTTSAVLTLTSGTSNFPLVTGIPVVGNQTGTSGNGAERTGVAMSSALAAVVAGVVLGATMV